MSQYCQTWTWRNTKPVLQATTKNSRTAKGERLQKHSSPWSVPFAFERQTVSPKLCYAGTEAVLPDQPVIAWVTRNSAFSSLAQITWTATWNSPNSCYTWSAAGTSHRSAQPVLSALKAINALEKEIPEIPKDTFKEEPSVSSLFTKMLVSFDKLQGSLLNILVHLGNKLMTEVTPWSDFDLPFHYAFVLPRNPLTMTLSVTSNSCLTPWILWINISHLRLDSLKKKG